MKRYCYAVRFLGGNRTCAIGQPKRRRGSCLLAIQPAAFSNEAAWDGDVADKPRSVTQASEVLALSKAELRNRSRGETPAEFAKKLDNTHCQAENSEDITA